MKNNIKVGHLHFKEEFCTFHASQEARIWRNYEVMTEVAFIANHSTQL